MMTSIAEKQERLPAGRPLLSWRLGAHQAAVDTALDEIKDDRIIERIWSHDHTVWKAEPAEITNRLGWLDTVEAMSSHLARLESLGAAVRAEGYTHGLILGMGGSSLAPEVLRRTFGVKAGDNAGGPYLDLEVLDSTDPGAVLAVTQEDRLDPARTLFIVASKSGGTVESLSLFKFFYNWMADALGPDRAGEHFVAITDPDSGLADLADRHGFRATFINDPNIGGRYSALSYFGMVPGALLGVDLEALLQRARTMVSNCESCNCPIEGDHNGARLGAAMSELAAAGCDKLTLVTSPAIASFGDWVEQLVAESTGKEGKGILPVVGEPLSVPDVYGDDRLFVYLRLDGDDTHDADVEALEDAGQPVVRLRLVDPYDVGGQFFLWEMATAIAGHRLGVNPFDQPDVEAAKTLARRMVAAYQKDGALPRANPTLELDGISVFGSPGASTPGEALRLFLGRAESGAYIALQAYLQPSDDADAALLALRTTLRDRTRMATTVGYGPRFLHSTGQLHKGDAGHGLFVQITADAPQDVDIPDRAGSPASSISFGVLKAAQALGDRQALLDGGRAVIRFHLGENVIAGLRSLTEAVS